MKTLFCVSAKFSSNFMWLESDPIFSNLMNAVRSHKEVAALDDTNKKLRPAADYTETLES